MALYRSRTRPTVSAPRPRRFLALLVVLALALPTACSFDSAGSEDDGGPPTSMTLATPFPITDLSPSASGFWAPEFGYGELLMRAHADGSIEPWLLESLEQKSPTSWLLTLNKGITFQNGTPLDAEMLTALVNDAMSTNEDLQAAVPGGEAKTVSALEVELTTDRPAGSVPSAFAHELLVPIYDMDAAEKAGDDVEAQVEARFWTGPYVVTEIGSEELVLEPNEDYWGGPPPLEGVTVRFIPDSQARVLAVQSDEADLALYPEAATARALEGSADATFVTSELTHSTVRMPLNMRDPILSDVDVRRALTLGIDYTALAEQVLPTVYEVATGMYPAHLPFAKETQKTNQEEAARLLDEAGWELGSGEYRERDGQRLTLTFIVNEQVADLMALAVALQDQLRSLGVEVKVQEVADIVELTGRSDDWSAGFLLSNVFGGDYVGDVQRYLGPGGRYNVGHVDDPELNELIEQAFAETDPEAQNELLGSIQDVVADQAYAIHPVERRTAVVASPAWEDYFIPMNNRWVEADTGGPGS